MEIIRCLGIQNLLNMHQNWKDRIRMPGWVELILRMFTSLIVLFFMVKWLAKKQISQMNVFEYIFGIVMGGVVAIHGSMLKSPLIYGIIAMTMLFLFALAIEFLSLKSKTFRDFVQGKSSVLIKDGKVMEDSLKKSGYSTDDLLADLRGKNIFQVSDVEFAVLEPNGLVNVLPKKENQSLTAKDLGIKLAPQKEPQTVIMDGNMLLEPLTNLSLNQNWLETELDKLNVSIENVFLGQVDSDGQLTVDLYDDRLNVPSPTEKPLLLANMKKCQADLELFASLTENTEAKQMYRDNSIKLQHAVEIVTPYLK